MKKLKQLLLVLLGVLSLALITACDKTNENPDVTDKNQTETDETHQQKIYKLAVGSGYTGTYEEWLASIRGDKIELKVESGNIVWKYTQETSWSKLVALNELVDPTGKSGKAVELSVNSTHILWKYAGDTEWNNLIALEAITSPAGQSAYDIAIELGFVGTVEDWITSLKGETGLTAYEIYKKYYPEYAGTEEDWINDLSNGNLPNNTSKVTVSFKDGNTVLKTDKYYYGQFIDSFEPEKEGYEFIGWKYMDQDWLFDSYIISKDIELEAQWAKIHTVSFVTSSTQEIRSIEVLDGDSFTVPSIEEREGFYFLGWLCNEIYMYTGNVCTVEADMELVADWVEDLKNQITDMEYTTSGGDLDIHINYNGESGISYLSTEAFVNPVDGLTYKKGDILPTWKALAAKTKTNVRDASSYAHSDTRDIYTAISTNGYKSETDSSQYIDLLYTTTSNLKDGYFIDLLSEDATGTPYIDYMPNFKKWWNENEVLQQELMNNAGQLYYTPYAEGLNTVERTFVMDTQFVEMVLDVKNANYDIERVNGGLNPAPNVVQSGSYTPYINPVFNYPDKETVVSVLVGNEVKQLKIKQTKNIIVQQNELLNRPQGCTGRELAGQFIAYLNAAFGHEVGENKIYSKLSEIFTSASAAYNADELIALMRVIKANPGLITDDLDCEIETFFPRGASANRTEAVATLMSIWGVQGMQNTLNNKLYFDANGKLNDAYTTQATYDGLLKLNQMYEEGLIIEDFNIKSTTANSSTIFYDQNYAKVADGAKYGFMMWDYPSFVTAANDYANGIGTDPASRIINYESKGIMPVLPPLAYWATESNWNHTQSITDHTGKTLLRYQESNMGIKTTSWGIPVTSDNIYGALRMMDYLYSDMGNKIADYGPEEYWETALIGYEIGVKPTEAVTGMISKVSNYWTFMRNYLGATFGIGHIRSFTNYVNASSIYAQDNFYNLLVAANVGVVVQSTFAVDGKYSWYSSTPKVGSHSDITASYKAITNFWSSNASCNTTDQGWANIVKYGANNFYNSTVVNLSNTEYTYSDVLNQIDNRIKTFLYTYAYALGNEFIPDYAKQ